MNQSSVLLCRHAFQACPYATQMPLPNYVSLPTHPSLCKSYQSQASVLAQVCFSSRPPKPMPELAASSLAICKADVLAQVCVSFHPLRPMEGMVCQGTKITHRCTCLNIVYSRTERIELQLHIAHFRSREDWVSGLQRWVRGGSIYIYIYICHTSYITDDLGFLACTQSDWIIRQLLSCCSVSFSMPKTVRGPTVS